MVLSPTRCVCVSRFNYLHFPFFRLNSQQATGFHFSEKIWLHADILCPESSLSSYQYLIKCMQYSQNLFQRKTEEYEMKTKNKRRRYERTKMGNTYTLVLCKWICPLS